MRLACTFLLLSLAACTAEATDEAATGEQAASTSLGSPVENPAGTYAAHVIALGTGCPAGTWDAEITPDGKRLALTMSSYMTIVNPGQSTSVKDCTVRINLTGFTRRAVRLTSTHRRGFINLDQAGMKGIWSMISYFTGRQPPAGTPWDSATIAGPAEWQTLERDEIFDAAHEHRSACGDSTQLNVLTRQILSNNPQRTGSGYFNDGIAEDASSYGTRMSFDLELESCE